MHRSGYGRASGNLAGERKRPLAEFLSGNPFEAPLTIGFFYREKMRAIHRVAPEIGVTSALELGGGRSGLTRWLYPGAEVVSLDLDPSFGSAPCNQQEGVRFVQGDATELDFPDNAFDAVTMFDLLEHVPDDQRSVVEALRVLKPGGVLLISTPHKSWRYPFYRVLAPICPPEAELLAEWGHVRRGYTLQDLERLITLPPERHAAFISPVTALCHDIAFSKMPKPIRRALCTLISPITWLGYWVHDPHGKGIETASAWRKPGP